jgi:transmembrane sensor
MEMKNDNNDTFLADWLAGDLSDEQLRTKVSAEDFIAYQKLRSSLDVLELQSPDIDASYAAVKSKRIAALDKKYQPKVIQFYRYAAIAASVLVLVGLYNLFVFSNQMQTGYGDTSQVQLSENSAVTLNAKSTVSYPNFFALNRTLKLDGEAFFEVSKGSKFTVETTHGTVEVLGTKFNVVARDGIFEVVCQEGKVNVCNDNVNKILLAGDAIRFYSGDTETWKTAPNQKPSWTNRESGFYKMPLEFVVAALENQYDTKIICPEKLKHVRFTGSFTHENLTTALQSVCIPMQLKYTQSTGKIVISE